MRSLIILLIVPALFFPFFSQAEEISLTPEEAVALALRDNRDILLEDEEVEKAKSKISEAKAGLFPSLNFTGSWTDTRGYYNKDLTQSTTQMTLKQYLYKGGKTINAIEQNKHKMALSIALLDKVRLEVILKVRKAFYALLLAQEYAGLNKEILNNTQQHLEVTQLRYQNGQASESEVLKMQESLAAVQEIYELSAHQIEEAESQLKNLLYLEEKIRIRPVAELACEPKELAYDEAFLQALKVHPEIRQYEAQLKADEKAIEIAKADARPNIYASWDYYSRSRTSLTFSPSKGWQDYNIIGLTFTWPLFDGWQTKAKVDEAIIDLKQTQLNQEKAAKDIALELKNAYLALKNALAKTKTVNSDIVVYQSNLWELEKKYAQGLSSLLDLEDARVAYQVAGFNKKQALYDYLIAKFIFEQAAGGF